MRTVPAALAVVLATLLCSCSAEKPASEETKKAAAPAPTRHAPPPDESRRFQKKGQKSVETVADHMLDKDFLPGGNLAAYQAGGKHWQQFIVSAPTAQEAANWLLDLKNTMKDPKFVGGYGAFSGTDQAGKPLFVFTKGHYLAGLIGLNGKDAETPASEFAALIPAQ